MAYIVVSLSVSRPQEQSEFREDLSDPNGPWSPNAFLQLHQTSDLWFWFASSTTLWSSWAAQLVQDWCTMMIFLSFQDFFKLFSHVQDTQKYLLVTVKKQRKYIKTDRNLQVSNELSTLPQKRQDIPSQKYISFYKWKARKYQLELELVHSQYIGLHSSPSLKHADS